MRLSSWLRHLRPSLVGAPLLFVVTVAPLAWIGLSAGWLGLPLVIILSCWTWSYAYLIVDFTARGLAPPVVSIEMLNPWHEPRPLLHLALLAVVGGIAWWLASAGATLSAVAVAALATALMPASLASLAVDGDLLRAAWPPTLLAIARGLGVLYAAVWALALGAAWFVAMTATRLPRLAWLALLQLLLFAFAAALGGALHERRRVLGLEVRDSPEKRADVAAAALQRIREQAVLEAYGLLRVRKPGAAWQRLEAALGPAPADPAAYRWLRDRCAQWDDRQIADRLTSELVARLIALGRRGEALAEVEGWWRRGGTFSARTARDLDVLKSVARTLGRSQASERLADCAPVAPPAATGRGNDGRT
jgi:hypothetical protein